MCLFVYILLYSTLYEYLTIAEDKMAKRHRPRRGSLAYSPRKRARSERGRIKREVLASGRKLQGFAGFKAGMTHLMMIDDNPFSSTKGMEIAVPATIIETPPLRAEGVRLYRATNYGKRAVTEVWARSGTEGGGDFMPIEEAIKHTPDSRLVSLHLILSTRPEAVSGVPKKKHDLLEIKMRGEVQKDLEYAKELLGKELRIKDVLKEGEYVDITAVTRPSIPSGS
jgi:large subunit ribosomal protein L3